MILRDLGITKSFLLVLAPAALGGALWEAIGLPLGWLMGAAVVTGAVAMANVEIVVPRPIYNTSLALLGASVGLAITPEVAAALVSWAPIMMVAAALGILAALMFAPVLSRWGKMETATAFFSLLPGGIVEMANVGERQQRALQIVDRRQQRLVEVAGLARDQADGATAPAVVDELHCAGGERQPARARADNAKVGFDFTAHDDFSSSVAACLLMRFRITGNKARSARPTIGSSVCGCRRMPESVTSSPASKAAPAAAPMLA